MSKLRADRGTSDRSDRSREGEDKTAVKQSQNWNVKNLYCTQDCFICLSHPPTISVQFCELLKYPEKWTNYVMKLLQVLAKQGNICIDNQWH